MTLKKKLEKEEINFFPLYKFTCTLPPQESMMLSYLIDAEDFVTRRRPENKDWFLCNMRGFMDSILQNWSTHQLKTALEKLERKGYISTKTINNNQTWIKLNVEAIEELKESYLAQKRETKETADNIDWGKSQTTEDIPWTALGFRTY